MEAHAQLPHAWEPQPTPQLATQSAPQSEVAVVSRNLNRYNICTNCSGDSNGKNRGRYDRPATSATKWGFFAVHRLGASVTHAPKSRPRQPPTAQGRLRYDDATTATCRSVTLHVTLCQSWPATSMSQMSQVPDTKNFFSDTNGVPYQLLWPAALPLRWTPAPVPDNLTTAQLPVARRGP